MSEEEIQPEHPLFKELQRKVKLNVQLEQDLIHNYGVQPNGNIILSMRLDLLMAKLMTEEQRYEYEIESAEKVHQMLVTIAEEVKSKKEETDIRNRLLLPDPRVLGPVKGGFINR